MERTGVGCPQCGRRLDPASADTAGTIACPCGVRVYAGYVAELEYLHDRTAWLQGLVAGQSAAPDPATAGNYGIWPAGAAAQPVAPGPAAGPEPRAGHAAQTLLLSTGAVLLIIAAAVAVAVVWSRVGAPGQITIMTAVTAATAAVAIAVRHRVPATAETLAAVAFGMAAIDAIAAAAMGVIPPGLSNQGGPYPFLATTMVGAAAVLAGRATGLRAWWTAGWFCAPLALLFVLAMLTWRLPDDSALPIRLALFGYLALGLTLAAPVLLARRFTYETWVMAVVGGLCALTSLLLAAGQVLLGELGTALVFVALLAALFALAGRVAPGRAWPALAVITAAGWLGLALTGPAAAVDAWYAAAIGLLGGIIIAGLEARGQILVGWLSWIAFGVCWGFASLPTLTSGDLADRVGAWLVAFGVVGFLLAIWPPQAGVAWAAAVFGFLGLTLLHPDAAHLELRTWPLAALLLLAGWLQSRAGGAGSLVTLGPAAVVALWPTALAVWFHPWSQASLIRLAIVLAVGLLLILIGLWQHAAGLVGPAAVAMIIAAASQVWVVMDTLPRWLALAITGGCLVLLGVRIEWLRGEGRDAYRWWRALG